MSPLVFLSHIYWVLEASKVKSDFSVYFSIEKSYSKKVFCIINLVEWQVYRVEKVGIYWLYLSKKSIFSYFKLRVYFWALIHKRGYIRSRNCIFFWILHSWINNPTLALFWFRPYFEKFFSLKLKLLKNSFGTRTLKPYITVNTHPKATINMSFWRK